MSQKARWLGPELTRQKAHVVPRIMETLRVLRRRCDGPLEEERRDTLIVQKIERNIDTWSKIQVLLPAFPFKSLNTEKKVLGVLPDMGEEIALRVLHRIATEISEIYPPGAHVVISSDGRVYADIVGITDETTMQYTLALKKMYARICKDEEKIEWHDLGIDFPGIPDEKMRVRFVDEYCESLEVIRAQIKQDPYSELMYCGLTRFWMEDSTENISREKLRQHAKMQALLIMQRNEAYAKLLAARYPNCIRLTIRPQAGKTGKIPVALVPESEGWSTPWHNVAVKMGTGKWQLMKRCQAEEMRYALVCYEERPYYFEEK